MHKPKRPNPGAVKAEVFEDRHALGRTRGRGGDPVVREAIDMDVSSGDEQPESRRRLRNRLTLKKPEVNFPDSSDLDEMTTGRRGKRKLKRQHSYSASDAEDLDEDGVLIATTRYGRAVKRQRQYSPRRLAKREKRLRKQLRLTQEQRRHLQDEDATPAGVSNPPAVSVASSSEDEASNSESSDESKDQTPRYSLRSHAIKVSSTDLTNLDATMGNGRGSCSTPNRSSPASSDNDGVDDDEDEAGTSPESKDKEKQVDKEVEGTGPSKLRSLKRYSLRKRKQVIDRYSPRANKAKGEHRGHRVDGKTLGRRPRRLRMSFDNDDSDDDVLFDNHQTYTALMLPRTSPAGMLVPPSAVKDPKVLQGGQAIAPWLAPPSVGAAQPWQASLRDKGNAEITPLQVDSNVSFDDVGGLDPYIQQLKEMIFLPLLYPEIFARFQITPPRGVLFYGPPGTGKTLVATALAATASRAAGKKVSFFMRKGADILSKWVGEAERQLRLLFEEAKRLQPSIIFFDEIDGLAPVRSSKQDQLHNSIVSTMLALMDGLDSRGQVVVIGATNRIDALDGALRRPGRFDRELLFPLPNLSTRRQILHIHTRHWVEQPTPDLLDELAERCVGYCGADLKALCTEAAMHALRRRFPQIYESNDKLLIDAASVHVEGQDFMQAFGAITPAAHRSASAHARPLTKLSGACLGSQLKELMSQIQTLFPAAAYCMQLSASRDAATQSSDGAATQPVVSAASLAVVAGGARGLPRMDVLGPLSTGVPHPRALVHARGNVGQNELAAAVLHTLDGLPVHAIGLPALLSDAGAKSPEEALVHTFVEAQRSAPSIVYLQYIDMWWDTASACMRALLTMLLSDIPADLPVFLLATSSTPLTELPSEIQTLFSGLSCRSHQLCCPTLDNRRDFFSPLIDSVVSYRPQPCTDRAASDAATAQTQAKLPVDPAAHAEKEKAEQAKRDAEERQRYEDDRAVLRALRTVLREIAAGLFLNKRYKEFAVPPHPDEEAEYWQIVKEPMNMATILARVDAQHYTKPAMFLADIALITAAAQQYYGEDPTAAHIVSRAHALSDEAQQLVAERVSQQLHDACAAIEQRGGPAPVPASLAAEVPPLPPLPMPMPLPVSVREPSLPGLKDESGHDAATDARQTRSRNRRTGEGLDISVLWNDPEKTRRKLRTSKASQSHASADVNGVGSQCTGDASPSPSNNDARTGSEAQRNADHTTDAELLDTATLQHATTAGKPASCNATSEPSRDGIDAQDAACIDLISPRVDTLEANGPITCETVHRRACMQHNDTSEPVAAHSSEAATKHGESTAAQHVADTVAQRIEHAESDTSAGSKKAKHSRRGRHSSSRLKPAQQQRGKHDAQDGSVLMQLDTNTHPVACASPRVPPSDTHITVPSSAQHTQQPGSSVSNAAAHAAACSSLDVQHMQRASAAEQKLQAARTSAAAAIFGQPPPAGVAASSHEELGGAGPTGLQHAEQSSDDARDAAAARARGDAVKFELAAATDGLWLDTLMGLHAVLSRAVVESQHACDDVMVTLNKLVPIVVSCRSHM